MLVSSPLFAASSTHITNWTVRRRTDAAISSSATFVAVTPCRVADTRNAAGPYGGPALTGRSARTFNIPGGPCTGIPVAAAYSLNFTIVNFGPGGGFIAAYPTGGTPPVVSTVDFGPDGAYAVANSAVVPADGTGSIDVYASANTDVAIDINGYFVEPAVTGITAGTGLSVTGTGNVTVGIDTSAAAAGQALSFTGSSTMWSNFISGVNAGTGLTGGGTSGTPTLNVNFAGTGTANTAARSDHTHYARTIIVSPGATQAASGTNFINAIAAVTAPSAINPWLIKIEPGIYDLGASSVNLPVFTDIEGSGESVTTIHGTGFGLVHLGQGSTIRHLTFDGAQYVVQTAIATTLEHVTVKATYATSATTAVLISGSGTHALNDVTINLTANGGTALTLSQSGSALNVNLHHVTLNATEAAAGTGQMQAIQSTAANIDAEDLHVNVTASNGAHIVGLSANAASGVPTVMTVRGFTITESCDSVIDGAWALAGSTLDIADGRFDVTGGAGGATGIRSTDSDIHLRNVVLNVSDPASFPAGIETSSATAPRTIIVQNSDIIAAWHTVYANGDSFTVQVSNTKLEGGSIISGTIPMQCTFVTDENMVAYTNTCP